MPEQYVHAVVLARETQVDNVNLQGSARILTISKVNSAPQTTSFKQLRRRIRQQ